MRVTRGLDRDRDLSCVRRRFDVDPLFIPVQGLLVEYNDNGITITNRHAYGTDATRIVRGDRLLERDVVDWLGDGEVDELSNGRCPIGNNPTRLGVAVDGHYRSVLGQIRERLTVCTGRSNDRSDLHSDGLRGRVGRVEYGKALIAALEPQHAGVDATGFGKPRDILRTPPVMSAVAIGVSDDQALGNRQGIGEFGFVQRRAVEDQLGAVDKTGDSRVDDAVAAPRQHDGDVLDADCWDRVRDADEGNGRQGQTDEWVADRLLIDHLNLRAHHGGVTKTFRRQEVCFNGLRPGE